MKHNPHLIRSLGRVFVKDGQLVETVLEESRLDRGRRMPRQASSRLLKGENLHRRRISRQSDSHIELMLSRPLQESRRSLTPRSTEGRSDLPKQAHALEEAKGENDSKQLHTQRLPRLQPPRKRTPRRGTILLEITLAITLLLFASLFVLQTNLQTIRPRNWAMVQALTDAYMTEHLAYAEAIDFTLLTSSVTTADAQATITAAAADPTALTSPWPVFPAQLQQNVTVGTLPILGNATGIPITGILRQTRNPSPLNLPANPTAAELALNPAQIESWILESHLEYRIGNRTYVKSRSTVRTR